MKIAVFGATGGIGQFIVRHALQKGYEVNAYVRNPKKLTITHNNLHLFAGQVSEYDKIKQTIYGCDAVIIALGISMKWGFEDTDAIIAHKNIINAMKQMNVKRLIDWSTPTVCFSKDTRSFITIVPGIMATIALPKAKKVLLEVNQLVTTSNLDWTIVRFIAPKDTPFTGQVKVGFGDTKMKFSISREDIANFMLQQVESNNYSMSMPIIGS